MVPVLGIGLAVDLIRLVPQEIPKIVPRQIIAPENKPVPPRELGGLVLRMIQIVAVMIIAKMDNGVLARPGNAWTNVPPVLARAPSRLVGRMGCVEKIVVLATLARKSN
jgi:hypothetical protein